MSLDFLVAAVYVALVTTLGDLSPQHIRDAPVEKIVLGESSAYVLSPLLANDYKSDAQQIVSPAALVAVCACVLSLVFVALSLFFDNPRTAKSSVSARLLSLMYAAGTAVATVDVIKRYCGYWRPYFYDECDFDMNSGKCSGNAPQDANRSFPSGHAAISFVTLGHASLCLLGAARTGVVCVGTKDSLGGGCCKRLPDLGNFKILLSLSPAFLAAWISASRVRENDHWPADIVAGALIGATFAALFYFRYFPSVFDADSHLPRPAFVAFFQGQEANGDNGLFYDFDNNSGSSGANGPSSGASSAPLVPPNAQELC